MPLQRKLHWASRAYHNFLLSRANIPFQWGRNDCALFAADGILAMTGLDIAADFRGKYYDEASALEVIRSITGGSTVADATAWCAAKYRLPELTYPLMAQRGDLCVFEDSGRLVTGLIHLSGRHIVAVGESGLRRIPITEIVRAWHG
jgi:hypothetical protein